MPSSFELAIPVILRHEGGYVNNPADPGGATKYGVSLRWLLAHGYEVADITHTDHPDVMAIRNLTVEEATAIYRREWWDKYYYAALAAQRLATKTFDMAVNMGANQAHKLLQRALVNVGFLKTVVDGILGPATIEQANNYTQSNAVSEMRLLSSVVEIEVNFYNLIADRNPKLRVFLPSWLHRAYEV